MKILIAPDSFKESLDAAGVAAALSEGLMQALPDAQCVNIPLADGGEGTLDAIATAKPGKLCSATVCGPQGRPVIGRYGLFDDGALAVVELAEAAGLALVPPDARDAGAMTSFGLGEMIAAALAHRPQRLIIALGGSASIDGGAGMCQALGAAFFDAAGTLLDEPLTGAALDAVARVDFSGLDRRLRETTLAVACDVDNPLLGDTGAARVFGPQKGADAAAIASLEANLGHFYALVETRLGTSFVQRPGCGAAGGIGAACHGILGAKLTPGASLVLDAIGMQDRLAGVDVVITGEGRIDRQTAHGKTPAGMAQLASAAGIPVIAVGGAISADAETLFEATFSALEAAVTEPMSSAAALEGAHKNLVRAGYRIGRWLALGHALARNTRD